MSEDEDLRPTGAFRISINGEPYCESDDLTTLTMVVDDVRRRAHQRITLYATASRGPLRWMTSDLGVGDKIVIEIVDAAVEQPSEPPHCDFCGRDMFDVSTLVQGESGNICDLCIAAFSKAVHDGSAFPLGTSLRDESD